MFVAASCLAFVAVASAQSTTTTTLTVTVQGDVVRYEPGRTIVTPGGNVRGGLAPELHAVAS